jgi:hypothetical protein
MIHDARGEREKAVEFYRRTLEVEGSEGLAKVEARKYLKDLYVPPPDRERERVP